jgi:AraC-like DNA-binding protein
MHNVRIGAVPNRSLIHRGAYGPYILVGDHNRDRARPLNRRPEPRGAYCAVLLEDGQAALRGPKASRLTAPAGVILWPGDNVEIDITPASMWRRLSFDVMYQPRRPGGGRNQQHATSKAQAPPKAIWQVTPGPVVPANLMARFRNMMHYCCSHWWRGDIAYARSNNRLGSWLLDWIEPLTAPDGAPSDDLISRIERQVLDMLQAGVGVGDMARMAGLSRRRFHDVYLAKRGQSPGAFLRGLRIEHAKRLLRTTDYDLAGVALFCGYRSPASFSRSFKSATGRTPADWRRHDPE